jgi:hypothetical protein
MTDVLVRTRNVERTKSGEGNTHHVAKATKKRSSSGSSGGKKTTEGEAIANGSTSRRKGSGTTKLKRHSSGNSKDGSVASGISSDSIRGKKRTSNRSTATGNTTSNSRQSSNNSNERDKDLKKTKTKPKPASRAKSFDDCSFPYSRTDASSKLQKEASPYTPPDLIRQQSASALLTANSEYDGEGRTKGHSQKGQELQGNFQKPMPQFGYATPKHQIVHDLFVKRRPSTSEDEHDDQESLLVPSLITPPSDHGNVDNRNAESNEAVELNQRIEKNSRSSTNRESFNKKLPRNPPRSRGINLT